MPARSASARRYAQAVFEIALAEDRLDAWQDDLDTLAEAAAHREFVTLLGSARLSPEQKRRVLRETFRGVSDEAVNLAALLVLKGRFQALCGPLAREYRGLVDQHRGILRAEVVTAVELDPERSRRVEEALAQATGQRVEVSRRVDPAIVGGMVVRIGDRVLDGSVTSRLRGLRRALQEQIG